MDLVLTGTANTDALYGGLGNDTLDGAAGADLLAGGPGSDVYIVDNVGDVVNESPKVDRLVSSDSDGAPSRGLSGDTGSFGASFSNDGRWVVFASDARNLGTDQSGTRCVYLKDLQTGAVLLVSTNAAGAAGIGGAINGSFSTDGRFVLFESQANLVDSDDNFNVDIYARDLRTGAIELVSVDATGVQGGNWPSYNAIFSVDGRYVAFESIAGYLVAGDTNNLYDIFVKDLQTGVLKRVSIAADGSQASGGYQGSINPSFSPDGRYVLFESSFVNLVSGDTNNAPDVFLKDLQSGSIHRISVSANGAQSTYGGTAPSMSANGRYVVFVSGSSNLVAGDVDSQFYYDIFVRDLQTGDVRKASTSASGAEGNGGSMYTPVISGDGRYVAFASNASNLVPGDTNGVFDIFVKDMQSGEIQRVSTNVAGAQGNSNSWAAAFSSDAAWLLVESDAANLVPDDSNGLRDVFRVPNPFVTVSDADTVISSVSFVLPENVENLTLAGSLHINATGNDLANVVFGNTGNNAIDGAGGADTMAGAGGDDSYVVDNIGDVVTEQSAGGADEVQASLSHTLAVNVEHLVLSGSLSIAGTGNAQGNRITGNAGNNTLDGATGADTLAGGTGNDTYLVDVTTDVVTEVAGAGLDLVQSSLDWTLSLNVEKLLLLDGAVSGTGNTQNNTLTGNALSNVLSGLEGNDTLVGAGAGDTLIGGTGNDTYLANLGDQLIEAAGQGTDTVKSNIAWTLGAALENLSLGGPGNIGGTGNDLGNLIRGNDGNNRLQGLGGTDTLIGGLGADLLEGGLQNDNLTGGMGADRLVGGDGNDALIGGADNDTLTGGKGIDAFVFESALSAATNLDTVVDFAAGTDKLRLDDDVFTAFTVGVALTASQFVSGAGITTAQTIDQRIVYNTTTGALYYDADGLNGEAAVQFAVLGSTTHPSLGAGDFVIVG